jgi:hypothetical protein
LLSAVSRCCADEVKGGGGGRARGVRRVFFFRSRRPCSASDDRPSGLKTRRGSWERATRRGGFCFPPVPSSRVPPGSCVRARRARGRGTAPRAPRSRDGGGRARRAGSEGGDPRARARPRGSRRDRRRVRRGCARATRRHATHHHETAGEALLRGERGDRGRRAARRARGGAAEGGRQSAEHRAGDAGGRERARRGMGASTTRGAVCANSLLQHRSRK